MAFLPPISAIIGLGRPYSAALAHAIMPIFLLPVKTRPSTSGLVRSSVLTSWSAAVRNCRADPGTQALRRRVKIHQPERQPLPDGLRTAVLPVMRAATVM